MPNKLDLAAYIAILSALTVATLRLGNFFQLAGLSVFTGWATATTLTGGQVYAASRLAAGTASPWILRTSWILSIVAVSWLGAADVVVGLSGDAPAAVLSKGYLAAYPVLWATGLLAVLPLEIMAAAGGRGLADSERIAEQIASADDEILEIARQRNEALRREERLMQLLEHTAPAARSPVLGVETAARSQHLAPWHCKDCGKSGSEAMPPSIRQRAYAGHRKSCPARLQEGQTE